VKEARKNDVLLMSTMLKRSKEGAASCVEKTCSVLSEYGSNSSPSLWKGLRSRFLAPSHAMAIQSFSVAEN
jgi:hypothetical protein